MAEGNLAVRETSMGWSSRADADSPGRTSMNDFSNKASVSRGDSLAYSEDSVAGDGKNLLQGNKSSYFFSAARTEPHTPALKKPPCCKAMTINDSMASEESLRDASTSKHACCVIQ